MRTPIFWIPAPSPGRLAIMPRPQGGSQLPDEIEGWREAGITTLVSLLTAGEVAALDLAEEEALSRAAGIAPLSFPIPDKGVPQSLGETLRITRAIAARLRAGASVAIHCHGGIGRSSLIAACTLLQLGGGSADRVFAVIAAARGRPVPETAEQRSWVEDFAASLRQP